MADIPDPSPDTPLNSSPDCPTSPDPDRPNPFCFCCDACRCLIDIFCCNGCGFQEAPCGDFCRNTFGRFCCGCAPNK